ncbi:MAG: heme exporter protein CcmD [Rhodospirillales bacterium]|jgi:heme exporter protein D|nr:heme exporter protein CcmD [Rhodospirillales bacterium]
MENLTTFFEMGGYARFIWPAFGLSFVVLGALLVTSIRSFKNTEATLNSMQAAKDTENQ